MAKSEAPAPHDFCFNQHLIDAIPAPVCIQDKKGAFLGANRAFIAFFSLNEELLKSLDFNGLLSFEASEKNRKQDTVLLTHGGKESFEAVVQRSGQDERDVVFHKEAVFGSDGVIFGLVTTLDDLTIQRQAEQQLRHAQKMEAIGTLAGGIAHDFNNVLTPIIGYAEIIRLSINRKNDDKESLLQFVGEIIHAAKRAKSLVEQILTFSKSREQKFHPQYLYPIIKEVLKLIRATLPTNIKISQNLDEDCGMVFIDPVQFHQVLLNLCTNSAQSMGDNHGKLVVSLKKSKTDKKDVDWIELCVADSGAGIARDIQERVFEPYFTTKEKGQGTGMGLAMVHGIVKRWGGRIELKSEEGQGAAFHLFFPCVASEKSDEQGGTYDQALVGTEKIMVVDDQEAVLKVTKKILDTLGYTVSIFSSSCEAFDRFSSAPDAYDLIITDFAMPSMTGMELCAEVKKQRSNVPIILCTGYGEKFTDKDVAKAGFSAWFTKPVSLTNLASTVRNVLDSNK